MEITNVEVRQTPGWQSNLDLGPLFRSLGEVIAEDAARMAPVLTGALRDSYDYEVIPDDNDGFTEALAVYSDVEHSIYVELGTSKMEPQPHLRPALEQRRSV